MASKVDISEIPTATVTNLAKPKKKRSGSKAIFSTSWKYPNVAFDESSKSRFEGVLVKWTVDMNVKSKVSVKAKKPKKGSVVKGVGYLSGLSAKSSKSYVKVYAGSNRTASSFTLTRKNYYPFKKSSTKYVKVYAVTKAKWSTNHWAITSKYVGKYPLSKTKAFVRACDKRAKGLALTKADKKVLKGRSTPILSKSIIVGRNSKRFPRGKSPVGARYVNSFSGKDIVAVSRYRPYVSGVGVLVQGWNSKTVKDSKRKPKWTDMVITQATYFNIARPSPPSVSYTVGGEATNHTLTFTLKSKDDGTISNERYDTYYELKKTYRFGTAVKSKSKTAVVAKGSNPKLEFKISRNPNSDVASQGYRSILGLKPDEYVRYTLTVYNRGFSGNSKKVTKTFTYARPHEVSIKSVTARGQQYQILFDVRDYVEGAKANKTAKDKALRKAHPSVRYTTKYTLQRLGNFRPTGTGYGSNVDSWSDGQWLTAARSQPSNEWTDVYTIGSGERVFLDQRFLASFEPFKRTYYRIMPENSIYGMVGTPSPPFVVPGYLKIPSASTEDAKFLSVTSTEDGQAIQAIVAFHKSRQTGKGTDQESFTYVNSNGTELSWDTVPYAWSSTTPATSYDFTDEALPPKATYTKGADGKPNGVFSGVAEWLKPGDIYESASGGNKISANGLNGFCTYYIRDVQPMTKYYLRARRFLKNSGTRESESYGKYAQYSNGTAAATIEVKARPKNLKAAGPDRLVEGRDLSITWTYESDDTQTEYQVYFFQGNSEAALQKPTPVDIITSRSANDLETSVKDSAPYAVIPWSKISPGEIKESWIFDQVVYVGVKIKCDSDWSDMSNIVAVKVARAPQARIGDVSAVSTRSPSFTLYSTDAEAAAIIRILAPRISDWGPLGQEVYPEGTVVYSDKRSTMNWSSSPTVIDSVSWYSANVSLPDSVDLRDGYTYTLEYTAVNDETGLRSDTVNEDGEIVTEVKDFSVSYNETMPQPSFYLVADPSEESHSFKVRIVVQEASGTLPTGTLLEVYRVTRDGAHRIFQSDSWRNAAKAVTILDTFPPYSQYTDSVYRVAYRSANGTVAWKDRSYNLHGYAIRFDWGDPEIEKHGGYSHVTLPYNVKWTDSWTKNARVELHMDGQYAGYWRKGVDRTNNISTEMVRMTGEEQVGRVMALANYTGPVLVRLPDNLVFCANVEVNNLDVSFDSLTVSASFSAHQISMASEFMLSGEDMTIGSYKPIFN